MNDMKPAAKRKASRRAQPKRAKSARRPSTKSAKAAARRPSAKSAKHAKSAPRRAPVKRAKAAALKPAQVIQPKRLLARPKTFVPLITPSEITVTAHKFRVGEAVHLTAGIFARGGAGAVYKVTQLLPSEGDEQQYRIKSANEPHERVAKQSQLEAAFAPA
jgi:hypothetical protein